MLYRILQFPARIALWFYCKNLRINKPDLLHLKGPLILACNHPNSFLDAIILCSLFRQPIYSLARGDVFNHKWLSPFLKSLKMYPVYRTREGVENLDLNYATFDTCQEIFRKKGIVLIFSEGLCQNEWDLRPLKKGTARLAMNAWQAGIPLQVLPVGLNYSSFHHFGKNMVINFGNLINAGSIDITGSEGKSVNHFNKELHRQLNKLVFHIHPKDHQKIYSLFSFGESAVVKMLCLLPGLIGYLFHIPLYAMVKAYVKSRFDYSGHYDSMVMALLFLLYLPYLGLWMLLAWWLISPAAAYFVGLGLPLTAFSLLQLKSVFSFKPRKALGSDQLLTSLVS